MQRKGFIAGRRAQVRRVSAARVDRELAGVLDCQRAALDLLNTLEDAGRPIEPALRLVLAAGYDAARRLQATLS